AQFAEFGAVVEKLGLGIVEPDATLAVSRSAPIGEDVNILIAVEIEIHGAEPLLAARRRFHPNPVAACEVLYRHFGISGKDLDIANDRLCVAKLIVALHVGNDPERELWQIGRDADDEAASVGEILSDRLVCCGRRRLRDSRFLLRSSSKTQRQAQRDREASASRPAQTESAYVFPHGKYRTAAGIVIKRSCAAG